MQRHGSLPSGSPRSLWRASRMAAQQFVPQPYISYMFPILRRPATRLTLLGQLAWSGWRANENGTAVCGLKGAEGPRARWLAIAMTSAVGLALLVAWVIWALAWSAIGLVAVPIVTFFGALTLLLAFIWKAARVASAKAKLAHADTGAQMLVEVHVVASQEKGAGRALLERVSEEADRSGWLLALDASNDRLTEYYSGLGYQAVGAAVEMPYGERMTRMLRRPAVGAPVLEHQLDEIVPRNIIPDLEVTHGTRAVRSRRTRVWRAVSRDGHE
jgi:hypothetical protein